MSKLGVFRDFNGDEDLQKWSSTELRQNFKSIQGSLKRQTPVFTFSEKYSSFSEYSTSEANIPNFSLTIDVRQFDTVTVGLMCSPIENNAYAPNSSNIRSEVFFSEAGAYGYGGLSMKRQKLNSDEPEYVVFNLQSTGFGTVTPIPSSSVFFVDQPGAGKYKYYFSYITLNTSTYLQILNTRMYARIN